MILLIRHARAGVRGTAGPDDSLRPLDGKGERQADALPALLHAHAVARILSSPFTRCVQTVQPLARGLGLRVELDDALAEGASAEAALALLASLPSGTAACSHGDVIADVIGPGRRAHKGSVWLLEPVTLRPLGYLRPAV